MINQSLKNTNSFSGFFYSSPFGTLKISHIDGHVSSIDFLNEKENHLNAHVSFPKNIKQQLDNYFSGKLKQFDLSFKLNGTELQQRVWMQLMEIPLGETMSYSDLADKVGTHPRVVAQACRRNPIPIIIPCHRIIAKNGLGGYAGRLSGKMIEIKQWLLDHEKNCITRHR